MEQVQHVLKLVEDQNSPNNDLRRSSELEFNRMVAQDPTRVCYVLIHTPMDSSYPVDLKQSCLLHLRRLVPKYWSMAFPSFTGNPINQDLKLVIRENLIKLVVSCDNKKIRNSASYVIVQIAAADYPDEWPDLLSILYEFSNDFKNQLAVEGSLQVLNELFDDLVSDEQFWDQNVGNQLINHISSILSEDSLNSKVKINCVDLYKNVLNFLTSPEAFATDERKKMVHNHIPYICELFYNLLKKSVKTTTENINNNSVDFIECRYRSYIYSALNTIIGTFNKRVSLDYKRFLILELLNDFNLLNAAYLKINNLSFEMQTESWTGDVYKDITDILNEIIGLISLLQNTISLNSVLDINTCTIFIEQLVSVATLSVEDAYSSDFNTFITENTGLSGFVTVRDSINEFFCELNDQDSNKFIAYLLKDVKSDVNSWVYLESKFYILESIFQNEESSLEISGPQLTEFFDFAMTFLAVERSESVNPLLISRIILMMPKFFEKFENSINPNQSTQNNLIAEYNNKLPAFLFSFTIYLSNQLNSEQEGAEFIKAAILIATTSYSSLIDFKTDLNEAQAVSCQQGLFQIIVDLMEESEEDTLSVLLEGLSAGIAINQELAAKCDINGTSVVDLVMSVSFKDASNVQSNIEASDCLKTLLEEIDYQSYISLCEKSLPPLLNIISDSMTGSSVEYSAKLDLTLDLLNKIIESSPVDNNGQKSFPFQIFKFIYPTIKKLILLTSDDQILQSGGSVVNSLIQNATESFQEYKDTETGETGLQSLLSIVSKFLSLELSDSAALNSGTIVTSLINKFQQQLGDEYLAQILAATAQRLLNAKEVITVENLIMLFCNLVLLSPESMVNYLGNNLTLKDPKTEEVKSSLSLILPIWFQSFEVTRGYEKIKQNALALAKIFSLSDARIETLVVDGDLIPYEGDKILTRSMAKSMPDRYTQISASLKILKLLASELEFQCQQPNAEDFIPDAVGADDNDGWEDMDDIGVPDYDKLKSYVDSDEEEEEESPLDDDLRQLLIHFFKECTSKNLGNFQKYYSQLSDHEKTIITENVVF